MNLKSLTSPVGFAAINVTGMVNDSTLTLDFDRNV